MAFGKCLVRAAVITALAGGAAVVIAGPHRVRAAIHQARTNVNACIDQKVDDPIALRQQIRDLEAEYPRRIAAVEGDLSELELQIATLERDNAVAHRTAALIDQDLAQLTGLIGQAEHAVASASDAGQFRVVRVRHNERTLDMDDAYAKATNLRQMRDSYVSRGSDVQRSLDLLGQQRDRLSNLLVQLQTEQADFQAQLFALDTQIDAIARNDRLIEMLESRQKRIDEVSRYEAHSLEQITARLAQIRGQQDSRIEQILGTTDEQRYEQRAQYELEMGESGEADADVDFDLQSLPGPSAGSIEVSPEVLVIEQPTVSQKNR
jgi:hypothetical protein